MAQTEFIVAPTEIKSFVRHLFEDEGWIVFSRHYKTPAPIEANNLDQFLQTHRIGLDQFFVLHPSTYIEPMRTKLRDNIHTGPTYFLSSLDGGPFLEVLTATHATGEPQTASISLGYKSWYNIELNGTSIAPPDELKKTYRRIIRNWKSVCLAYRSEHTRRTWWFSKTAIEALQNGQLVDTQFEFNHSEHTVEQRTGP